MISSNILLLFTVIILTTAVATQTQPPESKRVQHIKKLFGIKERSAAAPETHQHILASMLNDPNMPASAQDNPPDDASSSSSSSSFFPPTIISDVMGKTRSINIFAGLTRDISSIARRLSSKATSTTVLAPINSAMEALPRKPWEDPHGTVRLEGDEGRENAQENLTKFVESHIVPISPWEEGQRVQTLAGQEIWWTSDGDKKMIQPGNIEVHSVAEKVANGEIWILRGVRNYG